MCILPGNSVYSIFLVYGDEQFVSTTTTDLLLRISETL